MGEKSQIWTWKNLTGLNGIIVTMILRMRWKKVPRKILRKVPGKVPRKMKMILQLHLVKIVNEKERVAKVENQENLVSLENLENPINPPSLQKDLKTLHFQIIRLPFKLFL